MTKRELVRASKRALRAPELVNGNIIMQDGQWYQIPPMVTHECCHCGQKHLVQFSSTKKKKFWSWVKTLEGYK